MIWVVDDAQRKFAVTTLVDLPQVVRRRQCVQPRLARLGDTCRQGRPRHGRDQSVDVGVKVLEIDLAFWHLPGDATAEVQFDDVHRSGQRDLGGLCPGVSRLKLNDSSRAGLGRSASRGCGIEEGGGLLTKHVGGVMLVGHPQCHPQIRVGAQVVLDHAGGTLRRQDQVQPERTAALGHVHDAVHELRHLRNQRCELVHHQDQARWALGVTAFLQFGQVLGALVVQQVLAIAQFGPQ